MLSGNLSGAAADGHYLASEDGKVGLWLGNLEDLWKLGPPRGSGGPWRETAVRAGEPSDPYLMTGYENKKVQLSHDWPMAVQFTIEVDFLANGTWHAYQTVTVPAGQTVTHAFPDGFSAHWVRVKADSDCKATAWFVYNEVLAAGRSPGQAATTMRYDLPASEYKTRLKASDPATWKPAPWQVAVPTSGVTLDRAGLFRPAMETNSAYLLNSFSVNHMLVPFRRRAGQANPPDGRSQVKFWDTDLRGSNAGRFMMGAGNTLRWIEQPELRKRLNELIDGIEACRGPQGYILAYPPDKVRSEEPNYARAWFTHGLIEAAIAGNPKAYGLLRRHADWFNHWEMLPKLIYHQQQQPSRTHCQHADLLYTRRKARRLAGGREVLCVRLVARRVWPHGMQRPCGGIPCRIRTAI